MLRIFIVATALLLSGCDTFHKAAYSIGSASIYQATGEVSRLCNDLEVIASKNLLTKQTPMRPETQCYFSDNSVILGARILNQHLVIDIQALNGEKTYLQVQAETRTMLETKHTGKFVQIVERFEP